MTARRTPLAGVRRAASGLSIAAALMLVGAACAAAPDHIVPVGAQPAPAPAADHVEQDRAAPLVVVPAGEPVRVRIPSIGVDARLVRIGLESDGAMEVPDTGLAGWYVEGPMPGHPDPAVIAAHVDSWRGRDVFADLALLAVGALVHVDYDSGDRVTFTVSGSEQVDKEALPVAAIWPLTNEPLLALITCGGDYDRSQEQHPDNIIVYATSSMTSSTMPG
jgi:hypothetical protein